MAAFWSPSSVPMFDTHLSAFFSCTLTSFLEPQCLGFTVGDTRVLGRAMPAPPDSGLNSLLVGSAFSTYSIGQVGLS